MDVREYDDVACIGEGDEVAVARIMNQVRASAALVGIHPSLNAVGLAASAVDLSYTSEASQWAPPSREQQELAANSRLAADGDGRAARRVAEILEMMEQDLEAVTWWHWAADLGDLDAQDYVRLFLS